MDTLAPRVFELLVQAGPGLVLVLAFLETVFITGLVMPTGPTIIITTLLAGGVAGYGVESVVMAALVGGALGDSGGFWIGRRYGRAVFRGDGFFARAAGRHLPRAVSLAGRHPAVGVSFARLVSFVRTLTPQLAGMSTLTYPRFLAWDLLGVAGWAATYVGVALLAGESWRLVTRWIGAAWGVLFVVALLALWALARRKRTEPAGTGEIPWLGPPEERDSSC